LLALGSAGPGKGSGAGASLLDEELPPLPDAERQVQRLARLYGPSRARICTGAAAGETLVKQQAGKYGILHFAAHGILDPLNPLSSYLVLAGGQDAAAEDGLLRAREMLDLELQADLAVLSACQTARGKVSEGEGLIGMTWALFVAGCPRTVVSQWKVDSAGATELMVEFHRNLRTGSNPKTRMTRAEALRRACLKLSRDTRYRHPFYWAPFILVGDGA
jgi:CHAT domain-containing protein